MPINVVLIYMEFCFPLKIEIKHQMLLNIWILCKNFISYCLYWYAACLVFLLANRFAIITLSSDRTI